jgi:ubiquinone biosynthesis protein UbiJ
MESPGCRGYLQLMDTEIRYAIAALGDSTNAGFARIERYIELQRAEFLEWREEVRGEFTQVRGRLDALTARVVGLEQEVMLLRDYATREIGEIRLELRELRARSAQTDPLRLEIDELTARVDRLEQHQPD